MTMPPRGGGGAWWRPKGVVLDMDGVLWHGDVPLPGLHEFFNLLNTKPIPYALATNNSSRTRQDYVHKLAKMGVLDVPAERIVTSGTATADYLRKHYAPGTPVYVFGSAALCNMISEAGFPVTDDGDARVVVAGVKWDLTYEDLKRTAYLIRVGADFIGTNPDTTLPPPEQPKHATLKEPGTSNGRIEQ